MIRAAAKRHAESGPPSPLKRAAKALGVIIAAPVAVVVVPTWATLGAWGFSRAGEKSTEGGGGLAWSKLLIGT
jgi:hypothetical protein